MPQGPLGPTPAPSGPPRSGTCGVVRHRPRLSLADGGSNRRERCLPTCTPQPDHHPGAQGVGSVLGVAELRPHRRSPPRGCHPMAAAPPEANRPEDSGPRTLCFSPASSPRNTHILCLHGVACYMTYTMHRCARGARLMAESRRSLVRPDKGPWREGNGRRDNRGKDEDRALDRVAVGGHEHHRKRGREEGRGPFRVPRPGEAVQKRGGGTRVRALATALVTALVAASLR